MRGLVARPKQRDALLVQVPPAVTPRNDPKRPRNRVRAAPVHPSTGRRAAGFEAFTRAMHGQKLGAIKSCASFKRPVSVRRGGAHKDGLDCNRGSTQDIAGSCIRHDGSKFGVALLRRAEELRQELALWTRLTQKYSLLGQRTDRLNDNRVALSEGRIDGSCRGAGTTILFSAWVLQQNNWSGCR